MSVILETSLGDLTVDLYVDEAPKASENFIKLCKTKYYNFCLFYNIQRDFVAQTGDPTGSGAGGKSIYGQLRGSEHDFFADEIKPKTKLSRRGLLCMANKGRDTNASQFFITLAAGLDSLEGKHTIFGEVVDDDENMSVLDRLNEVYCDESNRPYQDVRIRHTIILDDPFPDPDGLTVPSRSPSPTPEQLDSGRIKEGESLDDTAGLSQADLEALEREKEARAGAQILEMIEDLPDADIKPPDNVLFVCKLNPVTTDEDLELIFARFGTIMSCEVIRDRKTGDSLQYAFIEFETSESCEEAFFKMDNVLIDDRRIKVNFSQSVAKLWSRTAVKSMPMSGQTQYRIKSQHRTDSKYKYVYSDSELDEELEGATNKRRENNRNQDDLKQYSAKKMKAESKGSSREAEKQRETERDGMRQSETEIYTERDRERQREEDGDREKGKGSEREIHRRREGGREGERDRERRVEKGNERGKDESRERQRETARDNEKQRVTTRDSERQRNTDRDRERHRERERGREKSSERRFDGRRERHGEALNRREREVEKDGKGRRDMERERERDGEAGRGKKRERERIDRERESVCVAERVTGREDGRDKVRGKEGERRREEGDRVREKRRDREGETEKESRREREREPERERRGDTEREPERERRGDRERETGRERRRYREGESERENQRDRKGRAKERF